MMLRKMDICFVLVTIGFAIFKGKVRGQMLITTTKLFFEQSKPIEINCTSTIKLQGDIIGYKIDSVDIVTIKYIADTDECKYLISGESNPIRCSDNCGCDLNGTSTLYKYRYDGDNTTLTIQCVASGHQNIGVIGSSLVLPKAHGPLDIEISPEHDSYPVNETDNLGPLTCNAVCVPNCTYTWTGPDTKINSRVLEINGIKRSKNGTFTCTAMNQFDTYSKDVDVLVQYGPQNISTVPENQTYIVEKGKTLGPIYCFSQCYPTCMVKWVRQGFITMSNNLTIANISLDMTRNLTCVASNVVGQIEMSINVVVQFGPELITFNPNQDVLTLNETDPLNPFLCSALCLPQCSFQWTGPQINITGGSLSVDSVGKSHSGTYTCTARNRYGYLSRTLDVSVQYGPQEISINPENETYILEKGKTLGPIYCSSQCYPNCDIKWLGHEFTASSYNLTITNISEDKTGYFTCVASNVVGHLEKRVNVVVQYGPDYITFNPHQDVVKVNESDKLRPIKCAALCLPQCSFQWIGPQTNITGGSLTVDSIRKDHNGTYNCTVFNQYGRLSRHIDVIVQYGPTGMILSPKNNTFTLLEAETLKINCSADCYPECTYVWRGPVNHSNGHLNVVNIQRYQKGYFTCEAGNIVGNSKTTVEVVVYYPAHVTSIRIGNLSGEFEYAHENESLDFVCMADGLPIPDVKWFFTNVTGHTQIISVNGKHFIPQASCAQTGDYTCEVSNRIFPKVKQTEFVNITCPPTIKEDCSSKKISAVKRNQNISIASCIRSNPEPNVEWTKQNRNSSTNTTSMTSVLFTNNTLTYTSVVEYMLFNEEEVYLTMTAYNTFGNIAPYTYHVVITDKPFEPKIVSIACGYKTIIQWYPNFHGGSVQTFTIKYIENNNTEVITKEPVLDQGSKVKHQYVLTQLKPETYYEFAVVAQNSFGSTESKAVFCMTAKQLNTEGDSAALIAGGTAAGCICLALVVVTLVLMRRKYYSDSGKEKGLLQRGTAKNNEDEEDGLKDNPMYVSSESTLVYYQEKTKGIKDKKKVTSAKIKDKINSIEMGCVYENADDIINISDGPEYGNISGDSLKDNMAYTPKKNKDGLLYADLELSSSTGAFVIRGLENKNIYADIDLTKKAELLTSDSESDDTNERK